MEALNTISYFHDIKNNKKKEMKDKTIINIRNYAWTKKIPSIDSFRN